MPFVQQCDLIFPLADQRLERVDSGGAGCGDGAGNAPREANAQTEVSGEWYIHIRVLMM